MSFYSAQKRHFWREIQNDEAAFAKLKELGDKGFVDKRFSEPFESKFITWLCIIALETEDEAIIHSKKTAALLRFNAALKYAELALEVDPASEMCNYRKN